MKLMYRVSNDLRKKLYKQDNFTVVTQEYEQCGSFYYFDKLENAIKAVKEFDTGIIPMIYCSDTDKSDYWYEE